jgi:hypothetical protein
MSAARRVLAALIAAAAVAADAGAHDPYEEGYRHGFQDGWREGQRPPQARIPPMPVQPGCRQPGPPTILLSQADYGDGYSDCDATARVAALANGRVAASVTVGSALCGGDPAPGRPKTLRVLFFCGSLERELVAPEGQALSLRCD